MIKAHWAEWLQKNPVASDQWPAWAKVLRQFSKPEDKGIGDVVLRIIGDENSQKFKEWHQKTYGRPCNCPGRLKRWNSSYPF